MKRTITKVVLLGLAVVLSGCISVHEREPETVSTTTTRRTVATPVAASTTVERTTTY